MSAPDHCRRGAQRGGMKTIGICARSLSPGRQAMFDALGEALGVSFVKRTFDDDRNIDGWVLLAADQKLVSDSRHATRPCYVVLDEAQLIPCGSSSKITLSSGSWLPPVLRGQEITADDAVAARSLPRWLLDASPAAFKSGAPVWAIRQIGDCLHHYSALQPPPLGDGDALFTQFSGPRMACLLPLVIFVGSLATDPGWEPPPLQATFMVDDPNLHWRSYGFLDYRTLVGHARARNYHVSVATIPLDAWLVHPPTSAIFKKNPERISLLFHGNDHVSQELARTRSAESARRLLRRAIARIVAMESRTGLDVARVMAPPHGACSERTIAEMARIGFEAVCVSPGSLRRHNNGAPWVRTIGMSTCDRIAGLPVIPRCGLSTHVRNDILIAALLRRPIVPMTHHDAVADGYDLLNDTAHFIGSLGQVAWRDMTKISRSLYSQRRDDCIHHVKMLSNRITVLVLEGTTQIRVQRPWLADFAEEALFWRVTGGDAPWHPAVHLEGIAVNAGTTIEIASGPAGVNRAEAYDAGPFRLTPVARRLLTEGRDRALPSIYCLARRSWSRRPA